MTTSSETPRKWADRHNNELGDLAETLGNVPKQYVEKVGLALLDMISLERELAALRAGQTIQVDDLVVGPNMVRAWREELAQLRAELAKQGEPVDSARIQRIYDEALQSAKGDATELHPHLAALCHVWNAAQRFCTKDPDGWAVRMESGEWVGVWNARNLAELVCGKQPPNHGDKVIPVYTHPPAAPGMQLVPVEPTTEMMVAFYKEWEKGQWQEDNWNSVFTNAYRAMLAAAKEQKP